MWRISCWILGSREAEDFNFLEAGKVSGAQRVRLEEPRWSLARFEHGYSMIVCIESSERGCCRRRSKRPVLGEPTSTVVLAAPNVLLLSRPSFLILVLRSTASNHHQSRLTPTSSYIPIPSHPLNHVHHRPFLAPSPLPAPNSPTCSSHLIPASQGVKPHANTETSIQPEWRTGLPRRVRFTSRSWPKIRRGGGRETRESSNYSRRCYGQRAGEYFSSHVRLGLQGVKTRGG